MCSPLSYPLSYLSLSLFSAPTLSALESSAKPADLKHVSKYTLTLTISAHR